MDGAKRREQIVNILRAGKAPISGAAIAKQCGVSRQVIVQDIALLRAQGVDIISTSQGYLLTSPALVSRVFKVRHADEEVEEELSLFVDCGGIVEDVFVYHKVYGILRAEMNIRSRLDVQHFVDDIKSGKSSLLKNVTSGYHYHTVYAPSEQLLDVIQQRLKERGFLAQLKDYEPVEFE
jgi:hypothetical protein